MAEETKRKGLEQTQVFTPDFGNTFDDYGEYSEPVSEAPVRPVMRKRHLKRIRFPRLLWVALFLALAVASGILAAKWGWRWADDVLALTRPDRYVEVVINDNDDLDDITKPCLVGVNNVETVQDVIEHAVLVIIDELPHHGGDGSRDRPRNRAAGSCSSRHSRRQAPRQIHRPRRAVQVSSGTRAYLSA